jgi:hypothetical protein
MMSTCCSKHVEAWNKYIKKGCVKLVTNQNLLCLLWQHCRRPWSFTFELCSFDSGRTGCVWVRRVWNGSADPKSRQMGGAFRHAISQRKRWTSSGNSQTNCLLFMVMLWIGKMWQIGAMNSLKEGLMFTKKKGALGHPWSLTTLGQAADFYDSGIQNLVPRLNKCLDNAGYPYFPDTPRTLRTLINTSVRFFVSPSTTTVTACPSGCRCCMRWKCHGWGTR